MPLFILDDILNLILVVRPQAESTELALALVVNAARGIRSIELLVKVRKELLGV